ADTLLRRKIEHVRSAGAPLVVTSNPGCQLQLAAGLAHAGLDVRVRHIVDVLDEAYGGARAGDVIEVRR
ncbi:MAG: (Fe-S)-binding protein, partial [Dehalococcoidia bacterium]